MDYQEGDIKKCSICGKGPINRICLNEECIGGGQFLFCDKCRRDEKVRKYASQIFQIDAYSGPISLFSINSLQKDQGRSVQANVSHCRKIAQGKVQSIFQKFTQIQTQTLWRLQALNGTFSSQASQNVQDLLRKPQVAQDEQVINKVKMLNWLRKNKQVLQNPHQLSRKVQNFTKYFQQSLELCMKRIQVILAQFLNEIQIEDIVQDEKKRQNKSGTKTMFTSNKGIRRKSLINQGSKIKEQSKENEGKSPNEEQVNGRDEGQTDGWELSQIYGREVGQTKQKKRVQTQQRQQKVGKSVQRTYQAAYQNKSSKSVPPSILIPKQDSNLADQRYKLNPIQDNEACQDKRATKRKATRQVQKSANGEQPKTPPLMLQRLPTKSDYQQDQILSINLQNIAAFFYLSDQQQINVETSDKLEHKVKHQYQTNNSQQPIYAQQKQKFSPFPQLDLNVLRHINLKKIKYVQVFQIPKHRTQLFKLRVSNELITVRYSLSLLYNKLESMQNLEQLHIFTPYLFPNQNQFLSILLQFSNLKVVYFNCPNRIYECFKQYKEIITNDINVQIKILQICKYAGDLQNSDLKKYFPQTKMCTKIIDQVFFKNKQELIKTQIDSRKQQINGKLKSCHKYSRWFVPKDIKKYNYSQVPSAQQVYQMSSCFSQIRNCWIPQLNQQILKNQQRNLDLQKIQHLTLGYHSYVLQNIPEHFHYGQKILKNSFSRSLTNLKSLNFINLNINNLFLKQFFKKQCHSLTSLKFQFCQGLRKDFYDGLAQYCPKLKKISVNNLSTDINGDFIMRFQELQTVILPWSQMTYDKSQRLIEMQRQQQQQDVSSGIKMVPQNQQESLFGNRMKKFKFINLYGCTWFNTDFFALIKLDQIQHLNIGKCKGINPNELVSYLRRCFNLKSLCLDQIHITNQQLFKILKSLSNLQKLSIANCCNINFTKGNLTAEQISLLDRMSHLDARNKESHLSVAYTMEMYNPKYLFISRGFQVEFDQLTLLNSRQIYAFSEIN